MGNYANYPSLKNKIIFITGGGSGIGAALVKAFCMQQALVSFIDIDNNASQSLVKEIEQNGFKKPYFEFCDITDTATLKSAIDNTVKLLGPISVLINNAANDIRQDANQITPEEWQACMDINLNPSFFAATHVYPTMRDAGGGSIINISSINALWGPADMPGYVTAKSALLGMTKSLARNYGKDSIRVNAVLPGWVKTEKQLKLWLTPEVEQEWKKQLCIPKLLEPEDIARLVLFLSADDSAHITSQHYIIDCGRL